LLFFFLFSEQLLVTVIHGKYALFTLSFTKA
jgi:hypothetical protein